MSNTEQNVTEKSPAQNEFTEPIELVVSKSDSKLPSDKILNQIRNRQVKRGQFGIGAALIVTTVIALYCASPNMLGLEPKRYFLTHAVLAWIFLPGIMFMIHRAGIVYGLPQLAMFVAASVTIALPVIISLFIEPGFLAAAFLWIPQIPLLYWVHRLFKGPNRTAQNIQAVYDDAVAVSEKKEVEV